VFRIKDDLAGDILSRSINADQRQVGAELHAVTGALRFRQLVAAVLVDAVLTVVLIQCSSRKGAEEHQCHHGEPHYFVAHCVLLSSAAAEGGQLLISSLCMTI